MKIINLLLGTLVLSTTAQAQSQFTVDAWSKVQYQQKDASALLNQKTTSSQSMQTNIEDLASLLQTAEAPLTISLPLPNGSFADFRLSPSLVMAEALAEKYPSIRTFSGYQIDNPNNNGRFDITPHGFHGVFTFGTKKVFIEPKFRKNSKIYSSYFRKDALPMSNNFRQLSPIENNALKRKLTQASSRTSTKVTYRLAISTTAEYTTFHGGTKEKGLAALVTMVNRLNEVYQRDLNITLELVANNDAIVFTDAATDPFKNDDNDIDLNKAAIDGAIGNANYDVGHVVTTGGGGLAALGSVCDDSSKADGVTGHDTPVNDPFVIDYVAHEIGHQFGADHTFNGFTEGCNGNRESNSAFEPGSASTIMGYAGICGEQNLQNGSDAYFHSRSFDQINAHITTGVGKNCGTRVVDSNSAAIVNAGQDYTIPARTSFILTGSATDSDSDTLSYSWEQADLGPATNSKAEDMTDNGQGPLFRVWQPISEPVRTFPRLQDILANTTTFGELLPTTSREMNFRLMVRDNKGNVSFDANKITVVANSAGFSITNPTTGVAWNSSQQNITWNTAGSEQAPIACSTVNIKLSTNGGNTFDQTLLSSTPNDGSQQITLPTLSTSTARVKVSCIGNIFFAINSGNIVINPQSDSNKPVITGQQSLSVAEDQSITLAVSNFTFATNQTVDSLAIAAGSNYQVDGLKISPTANFNGNLAVNVTAIRAGVSSEPFTASIIVTSVNDTPIASNDVVTVAQDSSTNSINVLSNDSDIDGDNLTLSAVNYSGTGTATISGSTISYTPATGFNGSETMTYTINDGQGGEATATITVTVTATATGRSTDNSTTSSSGGSMVYLFLVSLILLGRKGLTEVKNHE